jgi:general secretion pathway protein L
MKKTLEAIRLYLGIYFLNPAAAFLRWWGNELLLPLPAFARNWLTGTNQKLLLRVHDETIQIRRADAPTNAWSSFDVREHEPHIGSRAHVLLLPAAAVLRRTVELPFAAISSLHEAASFQIGRITPYEAEQTYHATRQIDRNRANKTIRAEVAVIYRATLDRMLAQAEQRYIKLSAILVEGDTGKPPLDFLPYHQQHSIGRGDAAWRPMLVASMALLLATPFVVAYRINGTAKSLGAEVATASKVVPRATAARSQLEALVAAETFLPERLRRPHAIEALEAVARLTPDGTWLFRLELRADDALLSGFSSDLPDLLQRLDTAPFTAPELTSPVVNSVAGNQNRFDLRLRFRATAP